MAEFSSEKKSSMSSREHERGSARKSVAEKDAFATASSAVAAMLYQSRYFLERHDTLSDSKRCHVCS